MFGKTQFRKDDATSTMPHRFNAFIWKKKKGVSPACLFPNARVFPIWSRCGEHLHATLFVSHAWLCGEKIKFFIFPSACQVNFQMYVLCERTRRYAKSYVYIGKITPPRTIASTHTLTYANKHTHNKVLNRFYYLWIIWNINSLLTYAMRFCLVEYIFFLSRSFDEIHI